MNLCLASLISLALCGLYGWIPKYYEHPCLSLDLNAVTTDRDTEIIDVNRIIARVKTILWKSGCNQDLIVIVMLGINLKHQLN